MQDTLIQRYLGNKSPISDDIVSVVKSFAEPGDLVFDAFSGTLAVSSALRSSGFRVACNDINHFSWTFAKAYFSGSNRPWPSKDAEHSGLRKGECWEHLIECLTAPYDGDVPSSYRRTDIFDHYCEEGSKSAFLSSRGASGRRRFFSTENAILIDRALSRIRLWHLTDQVNERVRCILTASLLTAVEKISNTQGTYHDFPRDFVDSRALRTLDIKSPPESAFKGLAAKHFGKAEDTLEFVRRLPRHKAIYIDPPYNFRQYTSYYFMLNLISAYSEIDDLDAFFSRIEFVRGQNMESDFKSSFCSKRAFVPSLETLIRRANTEYVILSYFNGRNHWGEFKSETADTIGKRLLARLFKSPLFCPGSFECIPVSRQNYQSYGGFKARPVEEFLFVARKSKPAEVTVDLRGAAWIGQASV